MICATVPLVFIPDGFGFVVTVATPPSKSTKSEVLISPSK
jgi:hypothetical protein